MAWQTSSYSSGSDPRASPPHVNTLPAGQTIEQGGLPVARASMPSHTRSHHENPAMQTMATPPTQYASYHRPAHRSNFEQHRLASPPSSLTRPYDHYYGYRSSYAAAPNGLGRYGQPPHPYADRSPHPRATPPRDSELSGSPSIDLYRTGGCTCKKSRCLKLYCQCFALSTTCGPKCKCQTCHNTTLHADLIEDARKTILERNPSAFDDKFRGNASSASPVFARGPSFMGSPPASTWPASPAAPPPVPPPPAVASPPSKPSVSGPPPRVNKFGCKCRRSQCLKKYCECYQNSVPCGLNCRCTNCKNLPTDGGPPPMAPPGGVPTKLDSSSPRSVSDDVAPPKEEEESQDRMALMAAVAMTELFGKEPRRVSMDGKSAAASTEVTESPDTKRKAKEVTDVSSPEKSDDEDSIPHKRARLAMSEVQAPVRPHLESRDPSPVSVMTPQSYHRPYMHRLQPPPHIMPRHGPPPRPMPYPHRSASGPYSFFASPLQTLSRPSPTSYEDVIKSSGLPKSLSFRKICSKCGKTRGEHGELGFGNKCVFQECGKCGAGVQMHQKVGSPMGILCRLTVEQGATPGASAAYERKIRDLAARAELQKTLQEDKRERVERLAAQSPFVPTN